MALFARDRTPSYDLLVHFTWFYPQRHVYSYRTSLRQQLILTGVITLSEAFCYKITDLRQSQSGWSHNCTWVIWFGAVLLIVFFNFFQIWHRWPTVFFNVFSVVSLELRKLRSFFKRNIVTGNEEQAPTRQLGCIINLKDNKTDLYMYSLRIHVQNVQWVMPNTQ